MASRYRSAEIFEFQANAKALEEWYENEADDAFVDHCKQAVKVALDKELTDRQRQVYEMYYLQGIPIPKIAAEFGVYKSTISRTIKRANARLARVMRYTTPILLHKQAERRNRRIIHVQ